MTYARTGVGARAVVWDSESAALGLPESTGSPGAPAGGAPQYPLKPQCSSPSHPEGLRVPSSDVLSKALLHNSKA